VLGACLGLTSWLHPLRSARSQPAHPHGPPDASRRGRRPSSPTSGGPGPVDGAERPPGKCVRYRSRFDLATARQGHIAREAATSPGNGLLVAAREQPERRTAASRRRVRRSEDPRTSDPSPFDQSCHVEHDKESLTDLDLRCRHAERVKTRVARSRAESAYVPHTDPVGGSPHLRDARVCRCVEH
jgi:hypothetical protein